MGLPLSVSENGVLMPGTYSCVDQPSLPHESVAKKLQDPNFIRAYASCVVLVRPGKRKLHPKVTELLSFFGNGWYALRACPTLRVARAIASLAITSPRNVLSSWGRPLRGLAANTPDQLRWLRSNWQLSRVTLDPPGCGNTFQWNIGSWRDKTRARLNLASTIRKSLQTSPGVAGLSCGNENQIRISLLRSSTT